MNHNSNEHRHASHRIRRLAAAGTLLTATGLVAMLGVAGAAFAGDDDDDDEPWSPGNLDDFTISTNTIGTIPPGMSIPLPDDDDPPIYVGPSIPIFFDPSAPDDSTGPDDTLAPDDTTAPDDTAPPVDTAPDTPAPTDPPAPTTTSTPTAAPAPSPAPETSDSAPAGDVAPFLVITSATVDCSAVLHVTFETGALPELAPDAEHVVMFSPASNPTVVTAQRLIQRPQNGVFTMDIQSPLAEQYRIIVTADFEPANLEGVLLVDEADAAAPTDCPVPTSSG
jgi:hypothetical protein